MFKRSDVIESQRNLYESQLYRHAAIVVPPQGDSVKILEVAVREAPLREARISTGFNTVEFVQVEGRFQHFNFFGGARQLDLQGAVGNLFAHDNALTMEQAGDIHVNWTPRGWMRRDPLLGFEQHLYLRQPGYGASYITGGRLMEEVIAERARQLGDAFTLQRVIDEINAAGMIPASLIYWEVTGDDRMMRELAEGRPLPPR